MKNLLKISLLSLCLLFSSIAVIYSTKDPDLLKSDEHYKLLSTNIDDETYAVLVFTGNKLYFDMFEFDAGDVFNLTSEEGNFAGVWTAVDLLQLTYFTAKVESSPDVTTTTISVPETENQAVYKLAESEFLINIWGIVVTIPPFGTMFGGGNYLGKDAFFIGFTPREEEDDKPVFGSISPSEGAQESTLPVVTVTGINTTFRDDPPVDVVFIPPDGLTVGSISTVSNTEIAFDLTIAVDAPTTIRSVTVSWDDPPKTITGDAKFTVTTKP